MTDFDAIWRFDLRKGSSCNPRTGACLLDAVSWFEYGKLGDHPDCTCPVIATYGRIVDDMLGDASRQQLKVFIPRLIGTVDPTHETARAEYLAWQAIHVFAPLALDSIGLWTEAQKLRSFIGDLRGASYAAAAAARAAYALHNVRAAASAASYASRAAHDATTAVRAAAACTARAAARAVRAAAHNAATAADYATRNYATDYASHNAICAIEAAAIAALDGVLKIGKQAEPIEAARMIEANHRFALARGEV